MADETDDTASNPQADTHLPVSGEFDANNIPSTSSPLTSSDDDDAAASSNDINQISAQKTSQTQDAPNPAGPANSEGIGDPGSDGVASTDNRGMTNPS
jgi:hypothetical protein